MAALKAVSCQLLQTREEYHLTLRFIRQIPFDELSRLIETVAAIASCQSSFKLTLGELDSFPGVIWCGLKYSATLLNLQEEIDESLLNLNLPAADYQYTPHITLARTDQVPKRKKIFHKKVSWIVEDLEIRQSKSNQSGFELLRRVKLSKTEA